MQKIKTIISATAGGMLIALGAMTFLSAESRVIGALFFVIGLFTICTQGYFLYTGRICYVWENDRNYLIDTLLIWFGNFAGCFIAAKLILLTRFGGAITERAAVLAEMKLGDNLLSIFILAVFCNICIYIAVEGFNKNPHELGKYLALIIGVMVFILCGFEHCIANMFYISAAGMWSGKALVFILINTLGNTVGGWLLPMAKKVMGSPK